MRDRFVPPSYHRDLHKELMHLEEESIVIPLAMTNLLQDNVHKREMT